MSTEPLPISIIGTGAVSPAGWGVPALMSLVESGQSVPPSEVSREKKDGTVVTTAVLRVPEPADRSVLPKHPRLRRGSPISKFAAAAAIEAIGPERLAKAASGELRIGVICSLMNGCVNYSNRFFSEVLADPATASPILFPETVFNAPSSHLSTLIGSTAPNDTLVGDSAEFFTAIEIATEWLLRGDCDGCVIVAPEEVDWLSAEALKLYSRNFIPSEGAGAIYLERSRDGVPILDLPDPVSYAAFPDHLDAMSELRTRFGQIEEPVTLLADSGGPAGRYPQAEDTVFHGWQGPRISVSRTLGNAMGAGAAFQLIFAIESLRQGKARQALVVNSGGNEQAAGIRIGH